MAKWFTLIKWFGMAILIGLIAFQGAQLSRAGVWERGIVGAVSHAVDARDAKGNPIIIAKQDAAKYILALGQALNDTKRATEFARAQGAQNTLTRERAAARTTKGIVDDYNLKIAEARAHYRNALIAQSRRLPINPAPSAAHRGSGAADLPALPDPARPADDAATQARLWDEREASGDLSNTDALICTEQAIGFDALRHWVSAQMAVADRED